jgi:hypothetical protein
MNGKLWVDEFVTHHRDLKEINEGFDDMHVSHGRFGFAYQAQSLCGTFADGPFLGSLYSLEAASDVSST